jgi:hypothetical protein
MTSSGLQIPRIPFIKEQVGSWKFCAHEFTEDELVFGACEMIQHWMTSSGLQIPFMSFETMASLR